MTFNNGPIPPIHRRFNEKIAINNIRNRYARLREKIGKQVVLLQQDIQFIEKCQGYYKKDYKDWIIVSGIYNCMLNLKAPITGQIPTPEQSRKQLIELNRSMPNTIFPTSSFLTYLMDESINTFLFGALQTWGFELRCSGIKVDAVEEFLRLRMKFFEYDLPHSPLFCQPTGNWPL